LIQKYIFLINLKGNKMKMTKGNVTLLALLLLVPAVSFAASTGGTEFTSLYDTLLGWVQGYLGKTIAIAAFIVGLGMGVAKSSPVPALIGVVFAMIIAYVPTVMSSITGALV
jgi:conjugal transfer pilus assembly protein TraA